MPRLEPIKSQAKRISEKIKCISDSKESESFHALNEFPRFQLELFKFAVEKIKNKEYKESLKRLLVVKELLWEELHSDSWKNISDRKRDIYAFCIIKIISCILGDLLSNYDQTILDSVSKTHEKCLKLVDIGLLMGGDLYRKDLLNMASQFSSSLSLIADFQKTEIGQKSSKRIKNDRNHTKPLIRNPIECLSDCDIHTFKKFVDSKTPLVLKGAIADWPAVDKTSSNCWANFEYLRSMAGFRTFPVEIGKTYLSEDWNTKLMLFSEFLDDYILKESDQIGYLAQHNLFDQVPELRKNFCIPDYVYCKEIPPKEVVLNAWFGPKGTVSPLHYDPKHNIYAQVVGSKYVRLIPSETPDELVYPHREGFHKNSSRVLDVFHYDQKEFPKFSEANYSEVILESGDLLYIPPRHWHYVKSLETSFNISFWFD